MLTPVRPFIIKTLWDDAAGTPKLGWQWINLLLYRSYNGKVLRSSRISLWNCTRCLWWLWEHRSLGRALTFGWFRYQLGGQVFIWYYQSMMKLNVGNLHKDILGAWSANHKNSSTHVFSIMINIPLLHRWLTSALFEFVECFGYTLPHVVSKIAWCHVRFYVVGDNPHYLQTS